MQLSTSEKIALVLAGGKSSRYGSYKALAHIQDEPMLVIVVRRLIKAGFSVYVAVKNEEQEQELRSVLKSFYLDSITFIVDCVRDIYHPLVPIYTFSKRVNRPFLVTACDMPYIGEKSATYIYTLVDSYTGAVVPKWPDGKLEPLFAVYNPLYVNRVPVYEYIKFNLSMRKFIEELSRISKVIYVPVERLFLLEGRDNIFLNINEPI